MGQSCAPVPHAGSLILIHSWAGQIPVLERFPRAPRPNALIVFWSSRIMVELGLLMILPSRTLRAWRRWLT